MLLAPRNGRNPQLVVKLVADAWQRRQPVTLDKGDAGIDASDQSLAPGVYDTLSK